MQSSESEFFKNDRKAFINKENGEVKDKMELKDKIDKPEFEIKPQHDIPLENFQLTRDRARCIPWSAQELT